MLKKTIEYTDYNGSQRKEDHYFNLNKLELIEIDAKYPGGLSATINKLSAEENSAKIIELVKDMIIKSYGVKSEDGKRFIKNQEVIDSFTQTEAFSELFMELATDADKAANFFNGIVPKVDNNGAIPPAK